MLGTGSVALAVAAAAACGSSAADDPPAAQGDGAIGDGGSSADTGETTPPAPSPDGNVVTYAGTALGLNAVSANGRIHPHGAPTDYYFEYGPTTAYGKKTPIASLGPKLAAHYLESYDKGLAGWRGGSGADLVYGDAGFARYAEPTGDDLNHVDGIGVLHLVAYFYPGTFDADAPTAAFGGADPDLRDAKVRTVLRGNSWRTSGSELVWWSQIDPKHGIYQDGEEPKASNWAHTGYFLTDHLLSGQWETADYRLWNDTTEWTYSGTNREVNAQLGRDLYVYTPLHEVLSHLDTDFFHLLAYVDRNVYPTGSIDFDEIEVTYRNHSLVFPSNGGKLASSPAGSPDSPAALTDGWRAGAGKTWKSAPSPTAPLEIVYDFERPVVVQRVQLHQNVDFPSKDVQVLVSNDGGATWTAIVTDTLPPPHPAGPNFSYLLAKDLSAPAQKVMVRILNGYRADAWGLGEIEIFGTGAQMQTEDEFNRVNADITGLAPGETVHFRLVAVSGGKTVAGGDQAYTVPLDAKPLAVTGAASRFVAGTAKLEGRVNTLGREAVVFFEYGPDASYGTATIAKRAGPEITPRTVVETLSGLAPGATVHYRLVVQGDAGTTRGSDATFVAK
ncbi:MAG TPA: discoidin domain-containing protein [Labilithrix sp.]|nr:discoidin domain-containing protein [Labilithrix sp.]